MTTRAWRRGLPAVTLVRRASESALATEREREEMRGWLTIGNLADSPEDEAATHTIVRRANEILAREVGCEEGGELEEIRAIGTSLVVLEGELLQGLEDKAIAYAAEQSRHRSWMSRCAAIATGIGGLAAVVAVFAPLTALVVAATAAIPVALATVFARLYQNQREAAERLDEKAAAVRFLRVALSSWIHTDRPEILEMAAQMFVVFNSPTSEPLGTRDWDGIAGILNVLPGSDVPTS